MNNINELIKSRRSVRTFEGRPVERDVLEKLRAFSAKTANPFGVDVGFELLYADEHGLSSPVLSGAELFVCGRVRNLPFCQAAFGYSFEHFLLYAQSLGLGSVWIGGTMNRSAFEKAMRLKADELMPCVSPLGYTAKMSVREMMMRKGVKADTRLDFEELFFEGDFEHPMSRQKAGRLEAPLEAVRLAPSAVNRQPWRILLTDGAAHFYLRRGKGFGHGEKLDMQMIDMGIALCHFELSARAEGLSPRFCIREPAIPAVGMEYVASYDFDAL